jgi:hypothetical protein
VTCEKDKFAFRKDLYINWLIHKVWIGDKGIFTQIIFLTRQVIFAGLFFQEFHNLFNICKWYGNFLRLKIFDVGFSFYIHDNKIFKKFVTFAITVSQFNLILLIPPKFLLLSFVLIRWMLKVNRNFVIPFFYCDIKKICEASHEFTFLWKISQ